MIKRLLLELGGNDAAIILDDMAASEAAPKVLASAMANAGQICIATKRVYAPRAMYDELCAEMGRLADEMIVGDGLNQGTQMGPLQNRAQFERVRSIIAEAAAEGRIVAGGEPMDQGGYFVAPTIIRDLPDSARLVREEQFGPVVPILPYDDIDELMARVNDTDYGLAATVWTKDIDRGIAVARKVQSGTVFVNKQPGGGFDMPFGGAKQSGIGRSNGIEGLKEYAQAHIINVAIA